MIDKEAGKLIDKLEQTHSLLKEEYVLLFSLLQEEKNYEYLFERARAVREKYYEKDVYIRGLIEFTNYCKNDCFYCGIRKGNKNALRYRLTKEQIIECCNIGYELGFRTFVLQGGEDLEYSDDDICDIVSSIKNDYSDCAVTLSIGEKSKESYRSYYNSGADRYLLRHETADDEHYKKLHPQSMSLDFRKECLYNLKEIGYQVGCGIMVGSPFQTSENIADDLIFMEELKPHMIGIGPFVPHKDTPFGKYKSGTVNQTICLLSIIRLMLPYVLLPATTALGTIDSVGREKGILAGANVVMPNLSPDNVRDKYSLYDNKIHSGAESAQQLILLKERMMKIGYNVVVARGDCKYN